MKVILIAALTADGFIGKDSHHTADWTSKADKAFFSSVTKAAGAIVMGASTFGTINRALPGRRNIVYSRTPDKFTGANLETTNLAPRQLVEQLKAEGVTGLAVCGGAQIYAMFMNAGVVEELYLTTEPKLFGAGVPLFAEPVDAKIELIDTSIHHSITVINHYRVIPS